MLIRSQKLSKSKCILRVSLGYGAKVFGKQRIAVATEKGDGLAFWLSFGKSRLNFRFPIKFLLKDIRTTLYSLLSSADFPPTSQIPRWSLTYPSSGTKWWYLWLCFLSIFGMRCSICVVVQAILSSLIVLIDIGTTSVDLSIWQPLESSHLGLVREQFQSENRYPLRSLTHTSHRCPLTSALQFLCRNLAPWHFQFWRNISFGSS